tara:strand:- start:290 stop:535 length:246 start_codon:yes stop_codon:yes gene_type:complete
MMQMHCNVCEFLESVESDFQEIPANTLATRVKLLVIRPIETALQILEKIETISPENIPGEVLVRWDHEIAKALSYGDESFE